MINSKIEWTDHTFNPWWGCARVSPGCEHCYAEAFAKRTGHGVWGANAPRRLFGPKHWDEPRRWHDAAVREGVRRRVFCASMADVFEDRPELEPERAKLWTLIEATPSLDWLLLTKRPENLPRLLPWFFDDGLGEGAAPTNVWLGTTVEDPQRAKERIPALADAPAVVRFLSCEPLLQHLDLVPFLEAGFLDWVIVGGESGPGSRSFDLRWARSIVQQCAESKVSCFVKQLGAKAWDDHATWDGPREPHPVKLRDHKGGDMAEWPEDLRVREFPEVRLP